MSISSTWLKLLQGGRIFRRLQTFTISDRCVRTFADVPKSDVASNQVMVTGTENEERVRVRRARPGDVPRVLRFVREHARHAWPGLAAPPAQPQVVLCDYVARALAQGHSMLAEQQDPGRGWSQIRGLAVGGVVCPWDAAALEKWARGVRCMRSRRLMLFASHCLRAPELHAKYGVHNILQVVLIVPPDNPKSSEIISLLAKHAMKRGKDIGFPLIRFDVTSDNIAKSLEGFNLKKEWQLNYKTIPDTLRDPEAALNMKSLSSDHDNKTYSKQIALDKNYIAVYSANNQEKK